MARRITQVAVSFVVLTSAAALSSPVEGGSNPLAKAAVHVVAAGTSCKSLPALDCCSLINTSYIGTGDVDIVPVFFDLSCYTAVEFGLSWPVDWGSCSFFSCGTGIVEGSICNPGDGVINLWSSCQCLWSVPLGYGRLTAQSSGRVDLTVSPWELNHRIGVTDCGEAFDQPLCTYSAGIGWIQGDEPCLGGATPLVVEISTDAPGFCVSEGDTLDYTIHITNVNMYNVHDVALVDSLPAGTAHVSGGVYDDQTGILRLDLGTVQTGEAWTSFSLAITSLPGSIVTNHFAVTAREFWPKPVTHSIEVCSAPATEPTTWGQIKSIFR